MSWDEVEAEHKRLREMVKARRAEPLGVLAQTYGEAIRLAEQMKADGATREACQEAVTTALRAAWPKEREEPWHYLCPRCEDCGWVFKTCSKGSCGRPFTLPKQAGEDRTGKGKCVEGHTYAEPCWCKKGVAMRAALMKQPRQDDDAIEVAARTSKPTKIGR